ncbi:MAG: hypothetical protein NZM04_07340 [Methylacidiphilales bacterium]|nr:hypothetical protein [Candidatus Methylacidiphilales bacterium]MDW8349222.1 glycosyltransferase family 1 protein [Verrucomicrobiae bacterium]
MRIVVCGLLAQYPFGGVIWDYIQYVLGFRALGHEVWYLEDTGCWPYHPIEQTYTEDASHNIAALRQIMDEFGLSDRWIYRNGATGEITSTASLSLAALIEESDLVVNVSGAALLQGLRKGKSHWMYLDGDPMFTQIRLVDEKEAFQRKRLSEYDSHFTFGLNIGSEDCIVPTGGFLWRKTVQPISLEHWPVVTQAPALPWTTVMNWNSYASTVWQGERYGQKDFEFMRFKELPQKTTARFTIAMGQGPGRKRPTAELLNLGWQIVEPDQVVPDHHTYRDFILRSYGEWSVAKEGYVKSRSGWFSCRTACYLAAGRPAIVQDTGWSRYLPTGHGLFAFDGMEDILHALKEVESNYEEHCLAARQLAEEHFEATKVCNDLLRQIGLDQ